MQAPRPHGLAAHNPPVASITAALLDLLPTDVSRQCALCEALLARASRRASVSGVSDVARRKRRYWLLLVYLLFVAAFAAALWFLIPDDVKRVIYETYINPP
jgi:hypothetical protein